MFGVFTQFLPIYLLVLFSTQCGKSSRFLNFMKKNYTLFVYLPKYSLVPNVMYEKEKFLISLLERRARHCTSAFRLQNSTFNYVEKLIMR